MFPQTWIKLFLFRCSIVITLLLTLATTRTNAQLGPGGVSHETPNTLNPTQSDCRLWLDASSLVTLADGDDVNAWDDISKSAKVDKGFRESSDNFLPPFFRDDPSAAINGYPVVTFEDGRMLKVTSSTDLNTENITTYTQTIVLAFRTSEDVNSRQVLWEEGGGWRGMNIFIKGGELYLGAYDIHLDNDAGPGRVPGFGYNYVKTPIQPNTTYVISHIFYAPTDNSLNGYIKGYRNGSYFGTLINGGQYAGGIGGVYKHPNPIGIGAVNSESYNENGAVGNATAQYAFKGRLAEICYYNRLLNDAERIIVENYLGAKYYANIIVNDKFLYQDSYGKDVIGIGQTTDITNRHSVSQGRNPFEISPTNSSLSFTGANQFLFVGNNGMSNTLTDENVPNDPGSTKRLEKIWRFDETGDLKKIKFRFHNTDLPTLPSGFSKYTLIFDNTSPNFPNFSTENSKIYELKDVGSGFYEVDVDIVPGAFMTIGVLKPQVSFKNAEAYAIEGDPSPDSTVYFNKVYARLNYVPTSPVKIDFLFSDGTATRANDYGYLNGDVNNGISFPIGLQEMPIRIWVKNDLVEENPSTETFTINLTIGSNTTFGLGIGVQSQHTFTIYDNDPPPKIGFAQATSQAIESAGMNTIYLIRTGSTVGAASAKIKIVSSPLPAASLHQDFEYPTYKTVSFADGESIKPLTIDVLDDSMDEFNEFIKLQVYSISGAAVEPNSIYHTLEIVDDDEPPTVEFTSSTSQNYETTGSPKILIELNKASAKDVSVTYDNTHLLLPPTNNPATYGDDYSLTYPATIVIPHGDTLGYPLNFHVQQDGLDEDDETVEFELTGSVNANIGTQTRHVYTIKDYSAFEWKGAAGVGKPSDDIFWIDIDRQSGSHGDNLQTLTNFSPQNINVYQNSSGYRAQLQTSANLINGRKTLKFNGSHDYYRFVDSGLINTAPEVGKKDYFLVIKTSGNVTSRQVIYKQGGASRGFAIYIESGSLYFNAWNNENSDPGNPWGSGAGTASTYARYAEFTGLQTNTPYIVSCLFDKSASKKLRIYVNGQLGAVSETRACGMVYSHTGNASIGGADGDARFHDGTSNSGKYFNGYLAEMIHFTEAPVNETRRRLLENYFSGKYNIPLVAGEQKFGLNTPYTNEIAGIGQINTSDTHTDSQSIGILRMKSPVTIQNNSFLFWGVNDVPLEDTWPYSGGSLPTGVEERSGKVWRISKSGNISGLDVYIRYSDLQNATSLGVNDLKLLVHHNSDGQNFSGATVINAASLQSGYVAKYTGVNFSDGDYFTLGNSSTITPLPIELLSFTAEAVENKVELNWITATEIGNDHFEVERAGKNLRFEPILTQQGAGYSNKTNFYTDLDKSPLDGISYYRLKQVDYDGNYSYSDPVSVHFQRLNGDLFDFWIYPNPTKTHRFSIANTGKLPTENMVNLSLINISGQVVYSQKIDPTYTVVTIVLPEIVSSGMYMVILSNENFKKSYKLIVH